MGKRFIASILFALGALGCSGDEVKTGVTGAEKMQNNGQILVVYFSATGTTKAVAARLAEAISADIWEIRPAQPYTAEDLNWRNKQSRSSVEMADRKSRPAIAGAAPDFAKYTTIFIGFPIWWQREPSIVDTFIEANAAKMAGKLVVPFATSGSSGMGNTAADIQQLAPPAKVIEGRRFRASVDAETLKAWAEKVTK